jgi:hypothetical protein
MQAQDRKFEERMQKMKKDFALFNEKIVVRKCEPLPESLMGSSDDDDSGNADAEREDSGPTDESAIDCSSNNASYDREDFINEAIHKRYHSLKFAIEEKKRLM